MLPNGTVFSCLSFDIVAHETTHALLDGIHRHYINATNPDVLAFHEGFADIVALLQHFSFPEALRHQIAKTRGDLGTENLLAQLAQQFGQAIGSYGALRDALGAPDPVTHVWKPYVPSGAEMQTVFEPHARGSILVGAVFDAFVAIYKARTADLIRIATDGTGVLRPGAIHPDLVNRLAEAASKAAGHVLRMCIRALDYCPPVDITFGDYLRALITADFDLVPDDQLNYRIAFIEAFRRRGIYPQNVTVLSEESLRWSPPDNNLLNSVFSDSLGSLLRDWNMSSNRAEIYKKASDRRGRVHDDVKARIPGDARIAKELGIRADSSFDVHSARPARRTTPDGDLKTELVIEIVQTKYCNLDLQLLDARPEDPSTAFKFRGGTTLIIDLDESHSQSAVRYSIQKNIESLENRRRQRDFITGNQVSLGFVYGLETGEEPFALLHRTAEEAGLGGTYAK